MSNLTKLSPVTQVISVSDVRQDKNGRDYKVLRLEGLSETIENHGGIDIRVKTRGKQVSMTQWAESYLDNRPSPFYDAKVGDFVGVEIYQASNLEPYEITDASSGETREVDSYTFPCERGQNPATVLKGAGHAFAKEHQPLGSGSIADTIDEPEMAING